MDFVERIGPVLGILAFLGLAVLVFVLFQQARDIRRLREWAGRAPERAKEAVAASLAAAEARGEQVAEEEPEHAGLRGRIAALRARAATAAAPRLRELDRRLPAPPRYVLGAALVGVAAAILLTDGFGLVGGDDEGGGRRAAARASKPPVAVLNGTRTEGVQGVPQLASRVDQEVIEPAGYRAARITDTASSFPETVVMYVPGRDDQAQALATAVRSKLGETPIAEMSDEIEALADGAPLALVLGLDDAQFGGT